MDLFDSPDFADHEQVVRVCDARSGLRGIIAVHSTALGPAIGGCRIRTYDSEGDALRDVLRLSRGMSYKAAVAGVPFGGGKMVVIADPERDKTPDRLRAIGVAIEWLGGRYVTGEDVGTTADDMVHIRATTNHVMGLPSSHGGSGDPSARTALGCLMGIAASVRHRLGRADLHCIRVAVQGLGNVGWNLCHLLTGAGASLIVSDIRSNLVEQARQTFGAACVPPEHICSVEADVFAPCALGAVINDTSVSLLQVSVVAGGANNQLANEERHADALMARGILYAPDYVINAGGMIQLAVERTGLDWAVVERRVRQIGDTLSEIFLRAQAEKLPTAIVAAALAQERIARASHRIMP